MSSKHHLLLGCFILFLLPLRAQIQDSTTKGFYFGIEQNNNLYLIYEFQLSSMDISLIFKKEFMRTMQVKASMGRIYENRFSFSTSMGIERKCKVNSFSHFLIGFEGCYFSRRTISHNSYFTGVGPVVGLIFNMSDKIRIGSESSIFIGESNMIDNKVQRGIVDTFKFLSIQITYKLH